MPVPESGVHHDANENIDKEEECRNTVRIVLISDTHGLHHELELPEGGGDVLIHCGDFANRGSAEQMHDFQKWFAAQTQFIDRIVIAGNHDRDLQNPNAISLPELFGEEPSLHFLQDEAVVCAQGRLRVFGFSWETCDHGSYMDRFHTHTPIDIILSHKPPYWPQSSHKHKHGNIPLAQCAFWHGIPITCGGHLHWARGAIEYTQEGSSLSSCWFINASSQKPTSFQHSDTDLVFPPIVIEYDIRERRVMKVEGLHPKHDVDHRSIPKYFDQKSNWKV